MLCEFTFTLFICACAFSSFHLFAYFLMYILILYILFVFYMFIVSPLLYLYMPAGFYYDCVSQFQPYCFNMYFFIINCTFYLNVVYCAVYANTLRVVLIRTLNFEL